MKRLRKFNESKVDIDYDYIYQCFAEILDDGKAVIRDFKNDFQHYIPIDLKIRKDNPKFTGGKKVIEKSNIFDYINNVKYNSELLQEVEVALNRLSDEYPSYEIQYEVFPLSVIIQIFSGKEEKEEYPF